MARNGDAIMSVIVKELYKMLESLIDEYGDVEVIVTYDGGYAATSIQHIQPKFVKAPMREYCRIKFEGYWY